MCSFLIQVLNTILPFQKLEPAQLRKIQSMDGGLGLPISRNGVSSQPQPRLSNWTSYSNGPPKLPGGPTVIEEPFKKLKKPSPQSQVQYRSCTPTPSNNGFSRTEGDKKQGGEGRGMSASTSFKSLSDSSSADTTDSKVIFALKKHRQKHKSLSKAGSWRFFSIR